MLHACTANVIYALPLHKYRETETCELLIASNQRACCGSLTMYLLLMLQAITQEVAEVARQKAAKALTAAKLRAVDAALWGSKQSASRRMLNA